MDAALKIRVILALAAVLLFGVVLFFSVLFPSAKILIALWAWYGGCGDDERAKAATG